MITPDKKDILLDKLTEGDGMRKEFNIWNESAAIGLSVEEIDAILEQFEKIGLCEVTRCLGGRVYVALHAEAHDMVLHGGFTAQEELLRKNIEKLELELKSLEPSFFGKAETISNIAANIATALGLFVKF